ncbi:unnamed protein product [Prorocentrum cordatum]|uniref:RNA-dependent RNA polymerase n=1 Tax=Prorocentrum cordatum TaxID=2364126 RepID=A0ABN9T0W0_9DINO|nr:unnamed protein product [Polarella glacialis]
MEVAAEDAEGALVESAPGLVDAGGMCRCGAFDDQDRPQGGHALRVDGVYAPTSGGRFARASQICCSDGYWSWWMAHPVEQGGAGRVLYHFCVREMCAAEPPAPRVTVIRVSEFEEVDAAELAEFYREGKGTDSWASWPEDLGPEPGGDLVESGSPEVDEHGTPLDSRGSAATPLEAAGARLAAGEPEARDAGALRARLKRLRGALQPGQGGAVTRPLEEVVQERAGKRRPPDVLAGPAGPASAAGAGGSGEGPLLQLLLEAASSKSSSADLLQSMLGATSGGSDGAVPRGLATRRGHFRQIAAKFPGLLSGQALAKMSEYVTAQVGEETSEEFPPIFLKYFLNVFIPQNPIKSIGIEVHREMRAVCEAADAILSGKTSYALDVLSQRSKALRLFAIGKTWSGARWLELIPPSNEQLALRTADEEIVRTVELGELRLEELLAKLKKGPPRTVQLRDDDDSKENPHKAFSWKAVKGAHPKRQGETRGAYGMHLRTAYQTIIAHVDGFLGGPLVRQPSVDWSTKVSKLRVDFAGEEQCEALPIRMAELIPGLPDKQHAAQLQTEEFVDEHILEWLLDPEVVTLPPSEWPDAPPRARVSCEKMEDWHEADIFAPHGQEVFNGLFAREKKGKPLEGQVRCARLIFNMIPSNAYIRNIVEDTATLAASTTWTSIHLPAGCVMAWSSDDQKGAFYVWKLPPAWWGRMAASAPAPASAAGLPGDHLVYVAFRVIPMGWVLAATLQPAHAWWQVYRDDFDSPEVTQAAEAYREVGTPGEMQLATRQARARAEVAYAEDKSHARHLQLERTGASLDGSVGTVRAPTDKTIELVRYILYALGRDYCPRLPMLTLLGRVVRALEFRRPLLSCLNLVWEFPTKTRGGRINTGMPQELLICVGYLPIACTGLRAAVSHVATVSDASGSGGGVCASAGLTSLAVEQLEAVRSGARTGMGVARGSSRLPVDIIGMVCSEIDKPARRVARLRWPGTADWGDTRSITEADVVKLADTYHSPCDVCACGASSPCHDFSGVNLAKAGPAGSLSESLCGVLRVHGLLRKHFKGKFEFLVENVASMSPQDREETTKELGVTPTKLCSSVLVPACRPRYYWRSWPLKTRGEITVEEARQGRRDFLAARRAHGTVVPLDWATAALFARGACPPSWGEVGSCTKGAAEYDRKLASQFTGEFLALSDRSGSDIRLGAGLPRRPRAWPRASTSPFNWHWRVVVSLRWQDKGDLHINARELQAGVAALPWRSRSSKHLNARFAHLFDSSLYPIAGYITTEDNPADAPSRRQWKARGKGKPFQTPQKVRRHSFKGLLGVTAITPGRYRAAITRVLDHWDAIGLWPSGPLDIDEGIA